MRTDRNSVAHIVENAQHDFVGAFFFYAGARVPRTSKKWRSYRTQQQSVYDAILREYDLKAKRQKPLIPNAPENLR